MSIPYVVRAIHDARGRELCLPGGPIAYRAAQQIVRAAQARWKKPASTCVEKVCIEKFYRFPKLHSKVLETLVQLSHDVTEKTVQWKDSLLERQEGASDMFTQNDHYLKATFDDAQKRIRRILGCTIDVGSLDADEKSELQRLLSKARKNLNELIALDPRDEAIWCMSAAYSYHKVVFKRFCDALPRAVDDLLLRQFVTSCRDALTSKLGAQR